jgi:LPXTG-site transpeptidase (sortase) family protein
LREHTETVSVSTSTNDLETVIRLLSPTLEYMSEDGYFGVLGLDVTSIQIESQGTTSSNFTATQTREFPHLSSADTSLVPRTITHSGRTYNLANVEWRTQRSTPIDYREVASTFTAVATYSRVGTRVSTIGYTTTAEYNGQISRIAVGRTEFTAHFIGIPIVTPVLTAPQVTPPTETEPPAQPPVPTPEPTPAPTPAPPTHVTVDQVVVGGIVIEVEREEPPQVTEDTADAKYTADDEASEDAPAEDSESGGFPFGTIVIVLLVAGGMVLAFFAGKKGKAMLSGMKKASCFLLAFVIADSLLLGTSQAVYAAELPRYGFGSQSSQIATHFNERTPNNTANVQSSESASFQSTDAVMHFNPSISDGISVQASSAGHFRPGSAYNNSAHGYNYGERIGTLTVERLGRTVNVIAGATMEAMDFGAGHFSFSGLNQGNTALIGHNRGARTGFFSFVRLLQDGDIITLEAGGIVRSYAVAMVYYVDETDFSPLAEFNDTRLTLVTCREYHRTQRRIAVAFAVD